MGISAVGMSSTHSWPTQIGEGNEVAVVLRRGIGLVRDPHLDALDGDTASDRGQRLHPSVVVVAEIMTEPVVAVLFVVDS